MPAPLLPDTPRHIPPPPTTENLDFADLAIIDFDKFKTPQGQAELVADVRNAMSTVGFFYVINHGYTPEQTRRIFDIAEIPFRVSDEEKKKYVAKMKEDGSYQGYKPRQYWHIDAGVRDQLEHYNIHPDVTKREHPEALRAFLPEIGDFARHNHFNVLFPLLRLLALGLELPEDTFVKGHDFDAPSETWIRFMKYYPRTQEDEEKTKNVWLKGHTDFGSLTLLWSQPVSALQIMTPDGKWKWVKHMENALVVNAGEALEFLSGRFYKGTIHRVVQPPVDQRGLTRLGVFYFALFNDDVKLVPLGESPVLQRVGITRRYADDVAPTMGQWRKGRIAAYGQTTLKEGKEKGVQEELINGIVVRHYN
ncbi:putative clavaminate synthase-like protein [Lyophyllum shimeji]|uniref:Clavaminate synthase-like protein n=1 Tax=Lyophyllum shimeji TaxID=47721 RepID=A0A9P3UPA8_LYOSH|nr:putative clavaminate synthase-like protein [Lyophyllum shimeji]